MGESQVVEPGPEQSRRDRAWVLLVALLVGTFAFMAWPSSAGAGDDPVPSCPSGEDARQLVLPSGAVEAVCEQPADEAVGSAATTVTLSKTVGTDPEACGTEQSITVLPGTEVFYCYTVTNTGSATATTHDLVDDQLGTLVSGLEYALAPGASTSVTEPAVIEQDTVNIATWTAGDGVDSAVGVDTAVVSIALVPEAPAITGVTVSEGKATISWDPPGDGGSPIIGYEVTPYVGPTGGTVVDAAADATSLTVDGLENGTTYTFTVAAKNAVGTGPASTASSAVTPQWWLPWSSGSVAVDEIFTWMTGALPSAGTKSSWLAQLDAGTKLPGDLVVALRGGTDATANVDPVVRLYSAYLVRIPDASGLNFWLGRRRAGWTLSRISSNFAASSEFTRRYGSLTNRQFVEQIYLNVLGRAGEASGVNFWTGQLDSGKKSRGQVMINFSESNEYKTKQVNKVHAAVVYIHLRGKTPTTLERDAFVDALVGGTSLADLVREQIHVPAFADRAG